MFKLVLLLSLLSGSLGDLDSFEKPFNISVNNDTNKDMYVVHAMVYQLGIITNATDGQENNNSNDTEAGAAEALTFYHTNGSNIDLNKIPQQLLPNLTGRNFVAPADPESENQPKPIKLIGN